MDKILVYIHLDGYLREWLTNQLGDPVVFPNFSYENALLARHITRIPPGASPQLRGEGDVAIAVPVIQGKPPTVYNYFGRRGRYALLCAIDILFRMDMWHSLAPYITSGSINASIEQWCVQRGISLDNREAVRQRFYRIRKYYGQCGIILRKKYREKQV